MQREIRILRKMELENRSYITILDLIRIINIISLSLLLGLGIVFLGVNQYISLGFMLFVSIILSVVSQRFFDKKFGNRYSISKNKTFIVISTAISAVILIYYIIIKEYPTVALIILFYTMSFIMRKKFKNS